MIPRKETETVRYILHISMRLNHLTILLLLLLLLLLSSLLFLLLSLLSYYILLYYIYIDLVPDNLMGKEQWFRTSFPRDLFYAPICSMH